MLRQTQKSLPDFLWIGIIFAMELALLSFLGVKMLEPLFFPAVKVIVEMVAPPAPMAEVIPPAPTSIPTLMPTATIVPVLNPTWVEIPLPQGVTGVFVQIENGTLFLAGLQPGSIAFDGLWKYNGSSWELLSENPAIRFPVINTGWVTMTPKVRSGVTLEITGNFNSYTMQMSRGESQWLIPLPLSEGLGPQDEIFDFVVNNDEVTIYLAAGQVWQAKIKLP